MVASAPLLASLAVPTWVAPAHAQLSPAVGARPAAAPAAPAQPGLRLKPDAPRPSGVPSLVQEPLPAAATERAGQAAADRATVRSGDYIVAIVNNELVTAVEVQRRIERARAEAERAGQRLAEGPGLVQEATDVLIDECVILTHARETGIRIDDAELERSLRNIAAQNQLTLEQLTERMRAEGIDPQRFRVTLREQLMVERARERDVYQRIRVSEAEVDAHLKQAAPSTAGAAPAPTLRLAQILIPVPEGASVTEAAQRLERAQRAIGRLDAGEDFATVARSVSEDESRERGGDLGARPADRFPDLWVQAVATLKPGEYTPEPVRSGAGFHVLKLVERAGATATTLTQTRARHILLRPNERMTPQQAQARLADLRRQITSGSLSFADAARRNSDDGSAAQGGELPWASPGVMVPEFEEAMARLAPGEVSQPIASRFGIHLIEVLERRQVAVDPKQVREQARSALREQKFEGEYLNWVRDLRAQAYVEMRDPPQRAARP